MDKGIGALDNDPRHIVDVLIEERARHLQELAVWPLIQSVFYPLLRYHSAKAMADIVHDYTGPQVLDHIGQVLQLDLSVEGLQHVPRSGRFILVANHPTGIVDGVAVHLALKALRPDMMIFANRDAIRACPGLADNLIPVEWVMDKRNLTKTKETLFLARKAFEEEKAVVIFPSGRLAYITARGLKERPWLATTINLMRRHQAPILPLNIRARNSLLYYTLHFLSNELRDMTIFNELLNKRHKPYQLTFGPLIEPDALTGSAQEAIETLQHHVEDHMGPGIAPPFS